MEVAPLYNPFDSQRLFKNINKFGTKYMKLRYKKFKQNDDCRAYTQSYISTRIVHQPSRLRRSGF